VCNLNKRSTTVSGNVFSETHSYLGVDIYKNYNFYAFKDNGLHIVKHYLQTNRRDLVNAGLRKEY
jgi:hypothetical protein